MRWLPAQLEVLDASIHNMFFSNPPRHKLNIDFAWGFCDGQCYLRQLRYFTFDVVPADSFREDYHATHA